MFNTTTNHDALLRLALNGTALELLVAIEQQAERVSNGYLEAERFRLSDALDNIEAYLTNPTGRGSLVLAAAGVVLGAWRAYVAKTR